MVATIETWRNLEIFLQRFWNHEFLCSINPVNWIFQFSSENNSDHHAWIHDPMNWNFSSEILVHLGSNPSWIGIIFLRKILVLSILWNFFFVLNSP
jgi:hypothetical protein